MDTFQLTTLEEYNKYLKQLGEFKPRIKTIAEDLLDDRVDFDSIINDQTLSEREFVEIIAMIRRYTYNKHIGGSNKAAENETDRLYSKNPWKFVDEFLQNADDCNYSLIPQISITIDKREETHPFIEFCYNENGFQRKDVWAITKFSESSKTDEIIEKQEENGIFYKEKTGRKGKGFKSVFSLDAENVIVHIRSNGFSFKLDNKIGRILPIWEDDPERTDEKTHVIVELINPQFGTEDIYAEFRRLFCIDDKENIFTSSPFLFMHRIKSVYITEITEQGEKEFLTEYKERLDETVYQGAFNLEGNRTVLSGIADRGVYFREQFQKSSCISVLTEDSLEEIPVVRYTRMIEDSLYYRNYSIMAPVLKQESMAFWKKGALFCTFPMSLHQIEMPLAIDAPYILNADRSGVQYSPTRDEKENGKSANEWNTEITEKIFGESGVLESFLLWLREIEGIRMDKYMWFQDNKLFEDGNNSDGHGKTWIPIIDLKKRMNALPVFRLYADPEEFVSYDEGYTVEKALFKWPCAKSLFLLTMGEEYEKHLVSNMYVGRKFFKIASIVNKEFVKNLNIYLNEVDQYLGLQSEEMIRFVNECLYPFLRDNMGAIEEAEENGLENLCVYYSRLQKGKSITIIREAYSDKIEWYHSENTELTSINRYRIFESSPVNMEIIREIVKKVFKKNIKVEMSFADNNINKSQGKWGTWDKIRDKIEAVFHFGYRVQSLRFDNLCKYALSENLDPEFNAFRITGVVEQINDDDVRMLAEYMGSIDQMVLELKRMGLKSSKDYYIENEDNLTFHPDTLRVLKSPKCPREIWDDLCKVKIERNKYVNVEYRDIKDCSVEILSLFLNDSYGLLFPTIYSKLCNMVQATEEYWNRKDIGTVELLIRACAGASKPCLTKDKRNLSITISQVLKLQLDDCVNKIVSKNTIGILSVSPDEEFEMIPGEKIRPLINMLKSDVSSDCVTYYKGNFEVYGSKNKFLEDGKGGHVYLHCDMNGDYKLALEEYLGASFDAKKVQYIDEMEQQYQQVKETVIVPIFNEAGHDLNRAYDAIDHRFGSYTKREIINILSWFRFQGYSNALGNGNINNEKEIEDDYKNDPWKFVYEFIQNVDDCDFEQRTPELNIAIDKGCNQIVFEYNENGFSLDDIKSLTKFGDSNKQRSLDVQMLSDGSFDREKTGRKGRGFKSVFALPGEGIIVHVCSNGFTFKFVKRLGQIIPIWEDINDSPKAGTRIIVEGLDSACMEKLMNQIGETFGVSNLSDFGSVCPVLYLRKLNVVSVSNGDEKFKIETKVTEKIFSENSFNIDSKSVAGIVCNGTYRESLWEQLNICIKWNQKEYSFNGARYTRMFVLGNVSRIASVFAPILDGDSEIPFKTGALYCTLPLKGHSISVPLSINAPFDTNSGRTALDDSDGSNPFILNLIWEQVLPGFFNNLRNIPDIAIHSYIPEKKELLFEKYKRIKEVDVRAIIRALPILRIYSSDDFVSCEDAKVLPVECYEWTDADILAESFDSSEKRLVKNNYVKYIPSIYKITLRDNSFVSNLNKYLDRIDISYEKYMDLLKYHVYPYLDRYYDDILKKYRAEGREKELGKLRIYLFTMSDGTYSREDADTDAIWIQNVPEEYKSFGNYRSICSSSLTDVYQNYKWLEKLHEIVSFKEAFEKKKLDKAAITSWSQASNLIKTVLYYNVKEMIKIPFLRKCALAEEFDHEENVFRTAFVKTWNEKIIHHLITREDLQEIASVKENVNESVLKTLADKIKMMGVKPSGDFFNNDNRGFLDLNESTLALLKYYCKEKSTVETVLLAIKNEFERKQEVENRTIQLRIQYEDIKDCHKLVFAKIFEYGVLSGDMQKNLADEFCKNTEECNSPDCAEALLRALNILEQIPQERRISIKLSEINDRLLGNCVQKVQLCHMGKLHLNIVIDIELEPYRSEESDKALDWLDDKNKVKKIYQYYTADLRKAFHMNKEGQACFLFDDTKVILNVSAKENSMLKFVQKYYKDEDDSFVHLVKIIYEQNELIGAWQGTKRKYIEKLSKYREDTLKVIKFLVPDYDKYINDANGRTAEYVLPELLQNINDCDARDDQKIRRLDVRVDTKAGNMLLQYDEKGFDYANVYSITAIGQSSKHDEREGEKGLGFKKVFTVFQSVEIYSNGFSFLLTDDKNTVPVWIDDEEKISQYMVDGKTTMLFHTSSGYKNNLQNIEKQLQELMKGMYTGNKISPLFLENIDYIYLDGCEKHYSRGRMITDFVYKKILILEEYKKLLDQEFYGQAEQEYLKIREKLKSRRKCQAMTEVEKEKYIDTLSVDICIPKRLNSVDHKAGYFYSTLPTESSTHSAIFMNVPFELTTGRDGIVDQSQYNVTVRQLLFEPFGEENTAIIYRALEHMASENRQLFIAKYFYQEMNDFLSVLHNGDDFIKDNILKSLEHAKLFEAYKTRKMVSLWDSYSVDKIICQYVREVESSTEDIQDWMQENCKSVSGLSLILPSDEEGRKALEKFAQAVCSVEGFYPIREENKDIAIDYFMDEYGCAGGDEI